MEGWGCGVVDVKPYGPCDSLFPGHSGRSCSSAEKTCDVLLATAFAIFASWHSCNSRYYDVLVHVS